jgi:hypothetical protein
MKKLVLLFALFVVSLVGYGQEPVWDGKVADTTEVFIVNVPVGFKVYAAAQQSVWVCRIAAASGTKISSNLFANFFQLSNGAAHNAVTIPTNTAHGLHLSNQAISLDTAYAGHTGTLSGTDWTTFNNKLSTEVDGSITNEGALTIVDGAGTADIHSNTSASTNVTIAAGANISVEGSGGIITIATTGLKTYITEPFELAADSSGHCILTLTQTPTAGTITVLMNNHPLKPTTQFTVVETKKIRMPFSCSKFSSFNISYTY